MDNSLPHNELVTTSPSQPVQTTAALSVLEMKQQVNQLHALMSEIMKEGLHYGHIPGTPEGKLALYKEGAEKLGLAFRLAPRFPKERQSVRDLPHGHREYISFCEIRHIPTGEVWAEIERSCSTMESKYRWRTAKRVCPVCGIEAIIKGQEQYGGGWLCWKKNEGCGAKFPDGDQTIEGQAVGRIENPDIADLYNTGLGMAQKRAHVGAIKIALACSDIFHQDAYEIEDAPVVVEVLDAEEEQATEKQEDGSIRPDRIEILMHELADLRITPGALKIYLHKTFGLTDPANLSPAQEEEVYQWIATQTTT